MRRWTIILLAGVALGAGPVWADDGSTALTFAVAPADHTPLSAANGGQTLHVSGGSGTLAVGICPVRLSAQGRTGQVRVGIDADGDGQIGQSEWTSAAPDGSASVEFALPAASCPLGRAAVTFTGLAVSPSSKTLTGRYVSRGSLRGEIAGQPVWLIDDNLDGRITQDGQDALLVGPNRWAVPLRQLHRVGGRLYRLSVDDAQQQLRYSPVAEPQLGQVAVPPTPGLTVLVLESDQGAFNVLAKGGSAVPAGEYRLSYGLLGTATQAVAPGKQTLRYPIRAGQRNTLRIGGAPELTFQASYEGGNISVLPKLIAVGPGGETYETAIQRAQPPTVEILAGNQPVDSGSMGFG